MHKPNRIIPILSKQDILRFWSKVHIGKPDECWEWQAGENSDGYGAVWVEEPAGFNYRAHRVAWTIVYGPIPPGMNVLHRCDVRACQNPRHLFMGSLADNNHDRDQKNRTARGERQGNAKLSKQDVCDIRRRYAAGNIRQCALAREYGITPGAIWLIVHRKCWAHVL